MVFRENLDFLILTDIRSVALQVPASSRTNANQLCMVTPEKFPSDITGKATIGKANLHNMSKAHHIFFARFVQHRTEFCHNDGFVVFAISIGNSLHRGAEIFRIQVIVARIVVSVARVVQVVGISVELALVEFLYILFKIVVANAKRFGAKNFRLTLDGIVHGIQGFLVTGNFSRFRRFKKRFRISRFHVRFILERNVVRRNTRRDVGIEAPFPPVGKIGIGIGTIGITVCLFQGLIGYGAAILAVEAVAGLKTWRSRPAGHFNFHMVTQTLLGGFHNLDIHRSAISNVRNLEVVLEPVAYAQQRKVEARKSGIEKRFLICRGQIFNPVLVIDAASAKAHNFLRRGVRVYRNRRSRHKRSRNHRGDSHRHFFQHAVLLFFFEDSLFLYLCLAPVAFF